MRTWDLLARLYCTYITRNPKVHSELPGEAPWGPLAVDGAAYREIGGPCAL